jgi:hypothetical protein
MEYVKTTWMSKSYVTNGLSERMCTVLFGQECFDSNTIFMPSGSYPSPVWE